MTRQEVRRVLVCGGRGFGVLHLPNGKQESQRVFDELTKLKRAHERLVIVQGGASGADRTAARWAKNNDIPCITHPANWRLHGKAAGPIRNAEMLEMWKPHEVIAFPGGAGTADMIRKARAAGIPVTEVRL